GAAVGPDGPLEGLRRARLRVLHRLREPQGPRARGEPARRALLLLARARPPGSDRGGRRARRRARVGGVLRVTPARLAAVGDRLAAERGRLGTRGARGAGRGAAAPLRRRGRTAPSGLGRLPAPCRGLRVLAAPRGPAPRPVP